MEEYATRLAVDDDLFFIWQVEPTVIFGRNQLIANEVNLDYCREHGIATYRRKSGGGCVYADMSNIMFSYITCSDAVQLTFAHYLAAITAMLRSLGLNATSTDRNDILIDGRKVSGNAFYHIPGYSIVHGTMLFDTDMTHMVNAITPSTVKLDSKGVDSVRSRITTLSRHLPMTLDDFKRYVIDTLTDGVVTLTAEDEAEIEKIAETYLTPEFIYGNNPRYNVRRKKHVERVGEPDISVEVNHDRIAAINIAGDFFLLSDIDETINKRLIGCPFSREAVTRALDGVKIEDIIMNLTLNQFLDLLFE